MASSSSRKKLDKSIRNLVEYNKQGHRPSSLLPPSISMVPRIYRDQNPSCFDPQVISIGPLHRAHKNVQDHEGLKASYLHDLLARLSSSEEEILERCLETVLNSIDKVRECYAVGMGNYNNFEVAEMMVTDACFILEFLLKCSEVGGLCPGNRFVMSNMMLDLALLENQIPFFVLEDIFGITVLEYAPLASLLNLLHPVIDYIKPFEAFISIENLGPALRDCRHILDVLHKAYRPGRVIPSKYTSLPVSHSAVELDLAGVNFTPHLDRNWQMNMKYELSGFLCFHRPTLRMPVVKINDKTELVLRNLIAYEQSSPINGYYFTSYACAMDMLVDSKEDVNKLVESKVIVNSLGSDESAADMFNNIFYGLYYQEFSYENEWKQLNDYYNRYWPKNIARLRQTYFNSPWNMIALVAVILLFVLTVIQTSFTVTSAYK